MDRQKGFCECENSTGSWADVESSEWGYWDICCDCGKRYDDGFHYYNHYDGADHDDIDFY